ncbi:MAG: sodium:solute symporter, partial [Bacteroidales bacterium]|nr:sodium:solute symporter [Bacteroidales bacterium]
MHATILSIIFISYTVLLFFITYITSRKADNSSFYVGNRRSPWFVVAYGMIGASLSGVTFMSVPGNVMRENWYYLPMVLGFIAGYAVVATVLLPLYYRENLTSIYTYLDRRFGLSSYRSGAAYFLLSRSLGASLRMFLVISVLHIFVFSAFGIPFWLAGAIFILLILAYTFKGGVKTIIWTDTLQTTFMIVSAIICTVFMCNELGWSFGDTMRNVWNSTYSDMFQFLPTHKRFFVKQFLAGLFVTITMTGLDQEMMQKNLSCKSLKDAQKNMFTFSGILLFMNLIFLTLGAVLVMYAAQKGIVCSDTDTLFPAVAVNYLPPIAGLTFVIGLISAAYPSADGAMTSITTSVTIDLFRVDKRNFSEDKVRKIRYRTHLCIAVMFFLLIIFFNAVKNDSIINMVYDIASYTYGPLLGLFFVGIFTRWQLRDKLTPLIVVAAPILSFLIVKGCALWLDYNFGFEILILNGLLTVAGL